MYDEDQNEFTLGEQILTIAALLGGGAAGRKMAGRAAIPTKKEIDQAAKQAKLAIQNMRKNNVEKQLGKVRNRMHNNGMVTADDVTMDFIAPRPGDLTGPTTPDMLAWMRQRQGLPNMVNETPSPFLASKSGYEPRGNMPQQMLGDPTMSLGTQQPARAGRKPTNTDNPYFSGPVEEDLFTLGWDSPLNPTNPKGSLRTEKFSGPYTNPFNF